MTVVAIGLLGQDGSVKYRGGHLDKRVLGREISQNQISVMLRRKNTEMNLLPGKEKGQTEIRARAILCREARPAQTLLS